MGKPRDSLIRGSYHLSMSGVETTSTRSLILRRRLQILVHSYIYYELNESLIPDHTWGKWAKELVDLQNQYPHISERVDYHSHFKDFDVSTGIGLPYKNPEIVRKAKWLLKVCREEKVDGNIRHKADMAKHGGSVVRLILP